MGSRNLKSNVLDQILTDTENWAISAMEDLKVYYTLHRNEDVSKRVGVEFIQRALEKAIKLDVQLFRMILISTNSPSPPPSSTILDKSEVKESLNPEFLRSIGHFFSSIQKLKDPRAFGHEPCTILMGQLRDSIPSHEYMQRSLALERETMNALISINKVDKGDSEVYYAFESKLRLYETELLEASLESNLSFSDTIRKVTKLRGLKPKDEFGFLVYSVVLLRLLHTILGHLALFTPMKVFDDDIREFDSMFSEIHNEFVERKLESETFKHFRKLMDGVLTISSYFPLCRYLGVNYSNLKYPEDRRKTSNHNKASDLDMLNEADDFFVLASKEIQDALAELLDCTKFFRTYIFYEDGTAE